MSAFYQLKVLRKKTAAAAAKSLQSCLTLCNLIDGSPPGSPVPGILQARTLEWVAISFSNAWKWKWSHSVVSDPQRPHGLQPTRPLRPWDFSGRSTAMGKKRLISPQKEEILPADGLWIQTLTSFLPWVSSLMTCPADFGFASLHYRSLSQFLKINLSLNFCVTL